MPTVKLYDGTKVHCLVRLEAVVLDHHVRGYFKHGIDIRDGDIVFDVGANIGIFSIRAIKRCPSVRVFAFEPVPDIYAVLARNSALHGDGRLFTSPNGVARRPGTARLEYYPNSPALSTAHPEMWDSQPYLASIIRASARNAPPEVWYTGLVPGFLSGTIARHLRRGPKQVECEMKTLSQFIREQGLPRVDLLKIDCEGAELDALLGIEDAHWPIVGKAILEVHDLNGRLSEVVQILRERGLTRITIDRDPAFVNTPLYNVHATRDA